MTLAHRYSTGPAQSSAGPQNPVEVKKPGYPAVVLTWEFANFSLGGGGGGRARKGGFSRHSADFRDKSHGWTVIQDRAGIRFEIELLRVPTVASSRLSNGYVTSTICGRFRRIP